MLTTVEKVIFLQDVDIFEYTLTEGLTHLAAITDEIELEPNYVIYKEGDIPDAMYMVIEGKVRLVMGEQEVRVAEEKEVFGTWALLEDEPHVMTATTIEACRLLKINKEDFIDLLADNVQITQSVLKGLVKKIRILVARAGR